MARKRRAVMILMVSHLYWSHTKCFAALRGMRNQRRATSGRLVGHKSSVSKQHREHTDEQVAKKLRPVELHKCLVWKRKTGMTGRIISFVYRVQERQKNRRTKQLDTSKFVF